MSWTLPPELLPLVGLLGFLLSWPRLRLPTSPARLLLEVFLITLGAALIVWLGWLASWLIEQRW